VKDPVKDNIDALIKKSYQLQKNGKKEEALAIFHQLNEQSIEDVGSLVSLGGLAAGLGEKIHAINICGDLVERYPDNATYLDNLGQAFMDNGMFLDAEKLFNRAIEVNPDLYHPYFGLGYIAIKNNYPTKAIEVLEKAVKLKSGESSIYINLVSAMILDARAEDAYPYAQKLLRLEPEKAESYHLLGRVLGEMGRFDEAILNLEKSIRIDRTYGYSYDELSSFKKFSAADSTFIKQAEKTLQMSMAADKRSAINFCLGKMYHDCKDWDKAFEYYKKGNLIAKPAVLVDVNKEIFNKSYKMFNEKFFSKHRGLSSDSDIPVFVVGMPRSGTTLIEQIIARHPKGGGAGELKTLYDISLTICPQDNLANYKQAFDGVIKDEALSKYIDAYMQVLCDRREGATRIVDKMPSNVFILGLIHLLFPKSHIIHAVRSPLDICLSCYSQSFTSLHWSYDLEWIAEQYKFYKKAMAYWKKTLPPGRIIEVQYEKMAANPEVEGKKLIESIGLQWDPACLDFHKAKGVINTASLWQVRQPVYTSSSRRWVNYAKNLEGLANELQEYLDAEDIEELHKHGIKLKKKWLSGIF